MGRALAVELARQGAKVAVTGRRAEKLAETVAAIEAAGGEGFAAPADVTVEAEQQGAVDAILDRWGRIDLAVANAGYGVGARFHKITEAQWRRQLEVNVVGAATTARLALPHLKETKGRVGLVASVAAMTVYPGGSAYSASKFALRGLGLALATELAGTGVSCTLIHPGFVATDIVKVDNDQGLAEDRKDPRPKQFMWSAEDAAKVMARALHKRRREFVFTGHGKLGAFFGQHFPGIIHFAMTRGAARKTADASLKKVEGA